MGMSEKTIPEVLAERCIGLEARADIIARECADFTARDQSLERMRIEYAQIQYALTLLHELEEELKEA